MVKISKKRIDERAESDSVRINGKVYNCEGYKSPKKKK